MQKHLVLAACLLLSLFSFSQKKIVAVLGSSTTAGFGASTPDSDYAHIVKRYYQNLQEIDTMYIFGLPGATTYSALPSSYTNTGRGAPDPDHNVTKALELNADIVLVNYPTNDIIYYNDLTSFLSNLRIIYAAVVNAHKTCYITTSQPRDVDVSIQQKLLEARDSIQAEFGAASINFWNPIVDPNSLSINPLYDADGTHVNNGGHKLLSQAVISANVLPPGIALPLSLTGFTAALQRTGVLLSWTVESDDPGTLFELERSPDGVSFQSLMKEQGAITRNYSWSDAAPLAGRNFYRLKITANEKISYSKIVVVNRVNGLAIDHLYGPAHTSRIIAGINVPDDQPVDIRIISAAGVISHQRTFRIRAPLDEVSIDLSGLAAGTYVLRVASKDGAVVVRPFAVF